jgi:hypothetical protein
MVIFEERFTVDMFERRLSLPDVPSAAAALAWQRGSPAVVVVATGS